MLTFSQIFSLEILTKVIKFCCRVFQRKICSYVYALITQDCNSTYVNVNCFLLYYDIIGKGCMQKTFAMYKYMNNILDMDISITDFLPRIALSYRAYLPGKKLSVKDHIVKKQIDELFCQCKSLIQRNCTYCTKSVSPHNTTIWKKNIISNILFFFSSLPKD